VALIKCKECGNDVSTKADACPKCGARLKSSSGAGSGCIVGFFKLIGGIIGLVVVMSYLSKGNAIDPNKELEKQCLSLSESYPVISERTSVYDGCINGGKAAFREKGINYEEDTAPIINEANPESINEKNLDTEMVDDQTMDSTESPATEDSTASLVEDVIPPISQQSNEEIISTNSNRRP